MKRRFSVGYINFEHVCKYYQTGDTVVKAVDDVNFTVEKGEFCVVLGPSGAGKTTILNLLGGMDKATSGTITVGGKQIIRPPRPAADGLPAHGRRLRLPVLQPDAQPHGA